MKMFKTPIDPAKKSKWLKAMRLQRERLRELRHARQFNVSVVHSFGTCQPLMMASQRTDWSSSADTCIARAKGDMPTRELWRRMQRIAQRRAK